MSEVVPKYATIDNWIAMSGMGRRSVYDYLGSGELSAVKVGTRTLVDVEAGLAWLRSRPPAVIRAPRKRQEPASPSNSRPALLRRRQ